MTVELPASPTCQHPQAAQWKWANKFNKRSSYKRQQGEAAAATTRAQLWSATTPSFWVLPMNQKIPNGPPTCSGSHRPAPPRASFHNQNTFVNLAELFLFYFTKSTAKKSCKVLAPPQQQWEQQQRQKGCQVLAWNEKWERKSEREEQWKQEEERPIFMFLCLANYKMNQRQSGPKPIAKQTDWHLCVGLRQRQRQRRLCRFRFRF